MHARSNFDPAIDGPVGASKRHEELVARIGDGNQFTLEDFRKLSIAEVSQLHKVNPDRYRALADGREPGAAWRPTAEGAAR